MLWPKHNVLLREWIQRNRSTVYLVHYRDPVSCKRTVSVHGAARLFLCCKHFTGHWCTGTTDSWTLHYAPDGLLQLWWLQQLRVWPYRSRLHGAGGYVYARSVSNWSAVHCV